MYNKISRILDKESKVKYWDFREGLVESNKVVALNNHIKEIDSSKLDGFSIRVLYGNGWGFVHSDSADVLDCVKKAVRIAKVMDDNAKIKKDVANYKIIKDKKITKCLIKPEDVSLEEKKDLVIENNKVAMEKKKIKSVEVVYSDVTKEINFINSEGSDIYQKLVYSLCGVHAVAKGNTIETFDKNVGRTAGYEITKRLPSIVKLVTEKAVKLVDASLPKGGNFPVVCDSTLTDVFVHEAVGHAAEGDIVLRDGSCLKNYMGKKIAPNFVNIFDDATQKNQWGSYFYDDEGVKAHRTPIIKEGILKGFMHNRESAAHMGAKPTGNGRAQSVGHMPLVRMSNTYIQKGDHKFEELIEGIKYGFYLKGSKGGQVDTAAGNFHFSAAEGYLIKNGEIKDLLKGVSLGGNVLKILGCIDKVSDTYDEGIPGFCGKGGQSVPAVGYCPSIMIKSAVVGGK